MCNQLDLTRQLVSCGDVMSHMYFHDLKDINLTQSEKDLEDIWLSNLKAHRHQILKEDEHPADFPYKYIDDHFIGFSVMRFILFSTCYIFCRSETVLLKLDTLEKLIKDSLRNSSETLKVWRINWSMKTNKDYLSELSQSEKYMFDFYFVSGLRRLVEKVDTLFPLQLSTLLNEHTMKFLRVLFRLLKMVNGTGCDFDFVSFFHLHKSSEDLELFYEKASQNSSYDRKIVNYVSLNYESVLNSKRKIEEAEDGDYIAVKVYLQTKVEILSSLEDDQEFIHDRISLVSSKVEDAKIELFGLTYSNCSFNGMSARKVASKLLEKTKKTKELSEFVSRKTETLRNLNRRLIENKEKIYIAKQYENKNNFY
jgi:hypothetical protein